MATAAGLPGPVADNVAGDNEAVDLAEMEESNFDLLLDIAPDDTGTPTVYDLEAGEKLDVHDAQWLDDLIQGGRG